MLHINGNYYLGVDTYNFILIKRHPDKEGTEEEFEEMKYYGDFNNFVVGLSKLSTRAGNCKDLKELQKLWNDIIDTKQKIWKKVSTKQLKEEYEMNRVAVAEKYAHLSKSRKKK